MTVKEEKVEEKVGTDELVSIMGGKMSEKEEERKKLFEAEDDDSKKEDTDTDEDKDEDKSEEAEKDDKKDDEKEDDKEELKEDEDEKKKDEDDKKGDDDEGDDKDSDKDKDEEVDEKKSLEDEVKALRNTINEMLIPSKVKKEESADEDEDEDEKKEETKLERKGKDYVFITQEVLDGEDFVVDAKFLNEFGNRIANQVKKDSLTSTAKIVKSHISETQKFRDLASDFYEENPDLKEKKIKSFVAYRVSVLANEHPDWSYEKLFSKLGEDVRGKLGLRAQAEKLEKKRKDKPAFVKKSKGKSKTGKEEVTGLRKEIDDLIPK